MADLLALSSKMIDSGVISEPPNRIINELSEIGDGLAVIESFSHSVVVKTDDGLVVFDTSGAMTGEAVVGALRGWTNDPIAKIVYTHGHVDHVGGSPAFAADAAERRHNKPEVLGHSALPVRLDRYERTDGYNQLVNRRQFGASAKSTKQMFGIGAEDRFLPVDTMRPDVTFDDRLNVSVGGMDFELRHDRGETDDHTWTWIPEHKMIAAGDLMIWMFPNCGNPQKVQRYPVDWAAALRKMIALESELFVPAHGLPIAGKARIASVLTTMAETLEDLSNRVIDAMNAGATLNEIVHSVKVDQSTLELPFMRPLYDEPEFVVRNLWRQFGGWWDADPANLKPPSAQALGAELASLAGGVDALVTRAEALAAQGDFRLACQLIEYAGHAAPDSTEVHGARARIYRQRQDSERSVMSKGIFGSVAAESEEI